MRDINKGNYLKELRLKNNLTQKDLGDLVHYSDKNISKWEQGKSFPQDDKTLNDLAAALGVDRKDLLCGGKHSIFESKIFKFSILGIVIVTIIVVAVALITKTRVYLIKADNKDIYIENGNYIVNHDYVNFSINYIDTNNSNEIESIELYKYVNNKPILLHRTNSFPIDIYKRKSEKNSLADLARHTTVVKIKYTNNSEMDIKLEFKNIKSNYANEENKAVMSTNLYSEPKSVEEYLTQLGFTEDSNSYIKKINDDATISYNIDSKYLKLESKTTSKIKRYKLFLNFKEIFLNEYSQNEEETSNTKISRSNYKPLNCEVQKCNKEEDYIGYLVFLSDKINSFQKEIK